MTNWDTSKLKEFADDKLDENGRQFSKQVENSVFPQCFQKTCTADI